VARRSRFRRSRSSPIRNREWVGWTTTNAGGTYNEPRTVFVSPTGFLRDWILTPNECAEFFDEPTIVRLLARFEMHVAGTPTQVAAGYRLTLRGGLIIWKGSIADPTLEAAALQTIDPQSPSTDWLWWDEFHLHFESGQYLGTQSNHSGSANAMDTPQYGKIDIRAKRKIPVGSGLAGSWELLGDSTGQGVWIHTDGRFLLLNN